MRTFNVLVLLAVLAAPVLAAKEDAPAAAAPKAAWEAMLQERNAARMARNIELFRGLPGMRAKEFLEAWATSGKSAEGEERFFIGLWYNTAERHAEAMSTFRVCVKDEGLPANLLPQAVTSFGQALLGALGAGALEGDKAAATIDEAEGFLALLKAPEHAQMRAMHHRTLAYCHDRLGRSDPVVSHWKAATEANPGMAYLAAREILGNLVSNTHAMEAYDGLRERAGKIVADMTKVFEGHLATVREGGNARAIQGAESALQRMPALLEPLKLLGQKAPEWTLVHAYGKTKAIADVADKVTIIDFWATWCHWCVKSFPALREVLRDYSGKDLALVGATTYAGRVWPSRYDIDDDLKDKGGAVPPVQLPRGATEQQRADFEKIEKETIAKFIENHEMNWDVVILDRAEPSAKYGLSGWPYAMVLDRQGRIRSFKSGALLRSQPWRVAKFRELLDDLLAEK
jgi:thiol-disulfide isomerase/thioredoxin